MPQKPNSKPVEYPDLLDETDAPDLSQPATVPDLSNPAGGFAPTGPVNTQYPGYKAFSVEPFQGEAAKKTFGLPEAATGEAGGEALIGAAKGLGHSVVGLSTINAGPEYQKAAERLQGEYLTPNPTSSGQEAGFQAEQYGEWFAPMGAEKKLETKGLELLSRVPGVRKKLAGKAPTIENFRSTELPKLLRALSVLPGAFANASTGAVVAKAQGQDPKQAFITGLSLSGAFGGAGTAARTVSDNLERAAEEKFMQAMGAVTKEQRARAKKVVGDMMKNAPFWMTRRGMFNWAADRAESAMRERAQIEAPIATTWGVPVENLKELATGQVRARSSFPNVPGYAKPSNISEPWTDTAMKTIDEYLGWPSDPEKRSYAQGLIKAGATLEQVRKNVGKTPGDQIGSAVYQAVRRGVPTANGKWIMPYIDMDTFKSWASKLIDYKHGWTTKKSEVWADEGLAPIKGIAATIAEEIRSGQPEIGKLNNIIESSMNVMDVLYPALEKPLPQEEGMKVLMGGSANVASRMMHIGMWHALLSGMRGVTNSTAWRTGTAAFYTKLANLIERGQVEKAGRLLYGQMGYSGKFAKEPFSKVTAPEGAFDLEVK